MPARTRFGNHRNTSSRLWRTAIKFYSQPLSEVIYHEIDNERKENF